MQFGAPPLLNELVQRGKLDAVVNFWNFNARLKVAGFVPVVSIRDILPALGLDADPPLLGWVFSDEWAGKNPQLARADRCLVLGEGAAQDDDAVWDRLRPIMDAEDDVIFQALKEGYRDGIPEGYEHKDVLAAESAFEVMRDADPASVANLERLPEGTFWSGYLK